MSKLKKPAEKPILYTDSTVIHSNQNGVVLEFVQTIGEPGKEEQIVARVGMSREHALSTLKALSENLSAAQIDLTQVKKYH